MIRAVFFDFYSVWTPDKIAYYLATAQLMGPEVYKALTDVVEQYYHGQIDITKLADTFRVRLGHSDITENQFLLSEASISPTIINFMRGLHSHFLKVGILANLGTQEYRLLQRFNETNQLFETIASPLSLQTAAPLLSTEVFAAALSNIGEPPDSTLLVSGSLPYLLFGANAGIHTLQFEGFANLEQSIQQLLNQPPTT